MTMRDTKSNAGVQPSVSPIFSRRAVHVAWGSTDKRRAMQVGNLRYSWPKACATIMRKPVSFISSFMTALAFGAPLAAQPAPATNPLPIVAANTSFALDLYQREKSTSGNLFFSPYSISSALAVTYSGARGQTETQMARVLH